MNPFAFIGISAGFCTTVCLIPQVLQIHKTHQTRDISLNMYIISVLGIILWLTYGITMNDIPLIITNTCSLPLCMYVLFMKIKH